MAETPSPPTRSRSGDSERTFFAATRSLCGRCRRPVEAKVVFAGGEVVLEKLCPAHGAQSCLISSSVDWYLDALSFSAPSDPSAGFSKPVSRGCPLDCGPCEAHQQRVRLPVIPITSACNLDCPVCYTINRNADAFRLSREGLEATLYRLRESGEDLDIINFTGGEPTLHPELPEMLELCREAGFERLTVSTNGLGLRDERLTARLAALGARIVLSLHTLDPATDRLVTGMDTVRAKLEALELLEKHDVATTLLPTICAGLNDGEVDNLLDIVLSRPHLRSLELHTVAFTGQGGRTFPRASRITIPDIHARIEEATGGRITGRDFVPSPLAHPHCYSICYLLLLDGSGYVPLARVISRRALFELLGDSLYVEPRAELERVLRRAIDELWAEPERLPESAAVLRTLRRLLEELFPAAGRAPAFGERRRISERAAKAIYIHSHMDEESFDVGRVMRCPVVVPDSDGMSIPTCSYNVLYRAADPRFVPLGRRGEPASGRTAPVPEGGAP